MVGQVGQLAGNCQLAFLLQAFGLARSRELPNPIASVRVSEMALFVRNENPVNQNPVSLNLRN
jgi:hypothetical protein